MDLSVIIVSWNVQKLLRACLTSVFRSLENLPLQAEIIVVDNDSSDGSDEMVAREFPSVRLLDNDANVGFTKANNQGLAIADGRYLLLLNPDAELASGALRSLHDYAEAHPSVGIIGPKLLFPDGTVQSSRRRFPSLSTGLLESTVLQRFLPSHPTLRRYYVLDASDEDTQEVDWVVGACMLVRREAIERVGSFDERFFMYSEELDLCYRTKADGWKVVYLPTARVVHHEAKSSEQNLVNRNLHFHDSKCKFFGKHHGRWQELLLRWVVLAHFSFLIVEDLFKLLLISRNRAMRRNRIGMLSNVVGWHLRHIFSGSAR